MTVSNGHDLQCKTSSKHLGELIEGRVRLPPPKSSERRKILGLQRDAISQPGLREQRVYRLPGLDLQWGMLGKCRAEVSPSASSRLQQRRKIGLLRQEQCRNSHRACQGT